MKRKKLLEAVEEGTQTAVEKGQVAVSEAAEFLGPYVEQAGDFVGPIAEKARRRGEELANEAYLRLRPVLHDARVRSARAAAETFDRVQPSLDDALERVTPAVERTVDRVAPAVDEALWRIPPTVDVARERVQHDLLPRLAGALHEAAALPLTDEHAKQLAAALISELSKPDEVVVVKKASVGKTIAKVVIAASILAGVVVAVRKLLSDSSSGWEAHAPSDAYIANPVADVVEDVTAGVEEAVDKAKDLADEAKDVAEDVVDEAKDVAEDVVDEAKDVAEDAGEAVQEAAADVAEGAEQVVEEAQESAQDVAEAVEEKLEKLADEAEGGDASPLAGSPYGEGSYVGAEPPQGFSIKGNDRSMKYHMPGSSAYERTIADVWFASPEAAEAAGFVRTQR